MRKMASVALALGAVASLGACVPGASFSVASPGCSGYAPWTQHSRTSIHTSTQRLQRFQARYSAGYRYQQANTNTWRQASTGECR